MFQGQDGPEGEGLANLVQASPCGHELVSKLPSAAGMLVDSFGKILLAKFGGVQRLCLLLYNLDSPVLEWMTPLAPRIFKWRFFL